jgi:hypothetical protein
MDSWPNAKRLTPRATNHVNAGLLWRSATRLFSAAWQERVTVTRPAPFLFGLKKRGRVFAVGGKQLGKSVDLVLEQAVN